MAPAVSKQVLAKKAPAKKAPAKKAPAKKAPAKKAPAKKAPAKKAPAKKAPAKKALAKKAPAKRAPAKKAPAKSTSKSAGRAKGTPARDAVLTLSQKRAIAAALTPAPSGSDVVDAYLRDVDHPFKAEMEAVRRIILDASSKLQERIKWNAPSFFYKEDFAAFNPRATEYAHLILLFPGGKGMPDSGGWLEGNHRDRREAKFFSMEDVSSKRRALEKLVKAWVEQRD